MLFVFGSAGCELLVEGGGGTNFLIHKGMQWDRMFVANGHTGSKQH